MVCDEGASWEEQDCSIGFEIQNDGFPAAVGCAGNFIMHTGAERKKMVYYIVIMNLLGFFLMGEDKRRARRHLWRISEKSLFLCSLLGGSVGTWAGMYVFRHKTRHWYFVVGMPLILAMQVGLLAVLYWQHLYKL